MRIDYQLLIVSAHILLPSFVLGFPTSLSTAGLERSGDGYNHPPGTLHPAIHPQDDVSDLNNLRANKAGHLYYETPSSSSWLSIHGAFFL